MVKNGFETFKVHFPEEISQEIKDYATNAVMDWSRYLFIRRQGKQQYAFCTHCKQESATQSLRHNHRTSCPACGSEVLVKGSGMGRQKMLDDAYLLYYGKSETNPRAIIARGFYLVRDYRQDYKNVETELKLVAMYLFEPGHSEMWSMNYYWGETLQKRATIYSEATNSLKYKRCYHSIESIKQSVNGTPFQYCTWEAYDYEDQVKVFDFAAKYPCMEYLTKLGMRPIVVSKLCGQPTFGAINWRGKTIEKVLRLTKSDAKEWLNQPFKSGLLSLYAYQTFKKLGLNLNFEQAHQVCRLAEKNELRTIQHFTRYAPLEAIVKYILKQANRKDSKRWYSDSSRIFADWKDYLAECKELGMDMRLESVLFPNCLHDAHQKTSSKIKFKRDEERDIKIKKRSKELDKFRFENGGLLIRPVASIEELFAEGKALQHCVTRYGARYADGVIELFVVRKVDEPDKPFYTMETSRGVVQQCRGFKNCSMTEEVKAFVDLFVSKKLLTKKQTRIEVTAINQRQEVAV